MNIKDNLSTAAKVIGLSSLLCAITTANAGGIDIQLDLDNTAESTNQIIVKYKQAPLIINDLNGMADILSNSLGINIEHKRIMFNGAQVLSITETLSEAAKDSLVGTLQNRSDIEYAHLDYIAKPMFVPNDTLYPQLWGLQGQAGINAETAWDINTGANTKVAVIDTGYRPHIDLFANIIGGYDFISSPATANDGDGRDSDASDPGDWDIFSSSSWHGTHVAGTIAAIGNNNEGVIGVAYDAQIVPIRALGVGGGSFSDLADSIVWASGGTVAGVPANPNPAQVINMSLGGGVPCSSTASTQAAINQARANGSVVVVSAGNSNSDSSGFTPASCDGVINVAAISQSGDRAGFSNFGSLVDIAAPGVGILSTLNSGSTIPTTDNYESYNGTSMSAPHVAGVAALLFSRNPSLTPDEVEQAIKDSARPFLAGSSCSTSLCGAGMLDATAALSAIQAAPEASFDFSCNVLSCDFADLSGDADGTIVSWNWSFGDGNSSTAQNPTHSYASSGVYSVELTVTDNDGLIDSTTVSVPVEVSNQSPVADFSFSCTDLDCSFVDSSSDADGSIASWNWDFGDGNSSTTQNPTHSYAAAGTYDALLTVTDDGGAQDAITYSVTVEEPVINISLTADEKTFFFFFKYVELDWTGATSSQVDIYRNNSVISTTNNDGNYVYFPPLFVSTNGTYKVCQAGTSICSDDVIVN